MNRNKKGQFVKGHNTWNKGKFGWMGANCTSFTKADLEAKRIIGKPRKCRDGMVCACEEKIPIRSRNGKVYMHQRRVSYSKWLMEQHIGRKLENNEVIYHIDGDKYNNDLNNLEIITRAELLRRNNKK